MKTGLSYFLSGMMLAIGAVFFVVGMPQSYSIQVNGSECVSLETVRAQLLADPLVQQYQSDNCSVVELLVKTEIQGSQLYQCVKGFRDGDCQAPDFVQTSVQQTTTQILVDLLDETTILVDNTIPTPPVIRVPTTPVASVPSSTLPTSTTPNSSTPTTPSVSQTIPTLFTPSVIYGVSTLDGVVSYTPSPSLANAGDVLIYDPSVSTDKDFEEYITVVVRDAEAETLFELSDGSTSDAVKNSLTQYANTDTATQNQKSSLIDFLQGKIDNNKDPIFVVSDVSNDNETKKTILADLSPEVQERIVEGELFIYTEDDENRDIIERVQDDLIGKFGNDIEYIEYLFPDTRLTDDIVVKYNTDTLSYQKIVAYLDTKDIYVSDDSQSISASPNVMFGHSSVVGFTRPKLSNIFGSDKTSGSTNNAGFAVQSVDELDQRHLEYIGYNEIASCVQEGNPIKVAIVDNGFDIMHEDLNDNIVAVYDEADKDNDVQVPNYKKEWNHGTKEAGLVGAEHNDFGVKGLFPNAELILVKSTKDRANGKDITNGIEAAAKAYELGADVINLSRGAFGNVPILEKVTRSIAKKGVHIVAAAGNYNKSEPFYPAAYDRVIAVAAVDQNGAKASFSNYGPWVDIAAPGVDMLTTDLDNTYEKYSGTSESSPTVTAALAMALSYGLTRDDIVANVFPTRDANLGAGILDVRFMCDMIPSGFVPSSDDQEHGSGDRGGFFGTMNTGKLMMLIGGALILLGILGGAISMLTRKRKT